MRVATWNVNGLRARLDYVCAWLEDRQPDVVGLQELKMQDAQFPHAVFEGLGYHALTHGQKAWNGVAVLSREPAALVQAGLPGQDEFGARLISVRTGGLLFTTVYCPNGKDVGHDDFPRKLAWFDDLRAHVAEAHASDEPAVLCGDFNVCPTALDSWNGPEFEGSIFHTDEERARVRAIFDTGYGDLFRDLHPDEPGFSWWDYRGGSFHRGHGLRIDFVLGTEPVRSRAREVWVDRDYRKKKDGLTASDHAPVIADLA
jgi:exodeoxyribonuclease-3